MHNSSIVDVQMGSKYASGNNKKYQHSKIPTFGQMYLLLAGRKDIFLEGASKGFYKIGVHENQRTIIA